MARVMRLTSTEIQRPTHEVAPAWFKTLSIGDEASPPTERRILVARDRVDSERSLVIEWIKAEGKQNPP